MATVAKELWFEAAHRLTSREAGVCSAIHGHSYRVKVVVEGPIDPETGMVMNFRELNICDQWDHALILNEGDPFLEVLGEAGRRVVHQALILMSGEPTAENIACRIFKSVMQDIKCVPGVFIQSVTVWETLKCSATVTRGDAG